MKKALVRITLKVEIKELILNVVSVYGSQAGCQSSRLHIDKGNRGDNEVLGGHGAKERNGHGSHGNGFLKRMEILVVKTF